MKLVVGLGNFGKEYQFTRHNVGFMYLDKYYSGFKLNKQNKAYEKTITINGEKVLIIKPTTFMNSSGEAVIEYLNYYKINSRDILVIHDDMDIPIGDYKLSYNHGSAGHNGIKSIINLLNSKEFYRLRIGISKNDIEMKEYVLGDLSKNDKNLLNSVFDSLDRLIDDFVELDNNEFMKKYNTK